MFKRFTCMFLSAVMCLAMSAVAFAAEPTDANTFVDNEGWTKVEDAELTMLGDGWAMLEAPAEVAETGIMPMGGTETWSATDPTYVGSFTMEGNNLTPVKTIKSDKKNLCIIVDSYSCSKPVRLSVQIRKAYTSTVLGSSPNSTVATSGKYIVAVAPVSNGSKVQIFFRITDANGNYDDNLACKISYSYRLVNDPFNP